MSWKVNKFSKVQMILFFDLNSKQTQLGTDDLIMIKWFFFLSFICYSIYIEHLTFKVFKYGYVQMIWWSDKIVFSLFHHEIRRDYFFKHNSLYLKFKSIFPLIL